VVFDRYGTLTPNWPRTFWDEQKRDCAVPLGIPEQAWIEALDATWHERVSGEFGGLSETFRAVAGRVGFTPTAAQLATAVEERYRTHRRVHELRPDAVGTLQALRAAGLKVGLVSDCTAELPELWDSLEMAELFDATVFSSQERTRKPDPRLFLAAAERMGVSLRRRRRRGRAGRGRRGGHAAGAHGRDRPGGPPRARPARAGVARAAGRRARGGPRRPRERHRGGSRRPAQPNVRSKRCSWVVMPHLVTGSLPVSSKPAAR